MIEEKTIWKYHKKLLFHLQGIFDFDKTALHCFLDTEFQYKDRDWYTGETWRLSFSDQLDYEEKIKLNEAKRLLGNFFKKAYINFHNHCLILCKYN